LTRHLDTVSRILSYDPVDFIPKGERFFPKGSQDYYFGKLTGFYLHPLSKRSRGRKENRFWISPVRPGLARDDAFQTEFLKALAFPEKMTQS
jgi:hypothetical protein